MAATLKRGPTDQIKSLDPRSAEGRPVLSLSKGGDDVMAAALKRGP
jgi:hypothetical protein